MSRLGMLYALNEEDVKNFALCQKKNDMNICWKK